MKKKDDTLRETLLNTARALAEEEGLQKQIMEEMNYSVRAG